MRDVCLPAGTLNPVSVVKYPDGRKRGTDGSISVLGGDPEASDI